MSCGIRCSHIHKSPGATPGSQEVLKKGYRSPLLGGSMNTKAAPPACMWGAQRPLKHTFSPVDPVWTLHFTLRRGLCIGPAPVSGSPTPGVSATFQSAAFPPGPKPHPGHSSHSALVQMNASREAWAPVAGPQGFCSLTLRGLVPPTVFPSVTQRIRRSMVT